MSKNQSSLMNCQSNNCQQQPMSTTTETTLVITDNTRQRSSPQQISSKSTMKRRRNRKNITLSTKLEIIKRLENGDPNSLICYEYDLPSSTVSTIRSKKEQIKAIFNNSNKLHDQLQQKLHQKQQQQQQLSSVRNQLIEEMEQSLIKWINDCQYNADQLRYSVIREKALNLFETIKQHYQRMKSNGVADLCSSSTSSSSSSFDDDERLEFKASHGWFESFRKRYYNQSLVNDDEVVNNENDPSQTLWNEYLLQASKILNKNSLKNDHVDNDQIPISIDEPITVIKEDYDDDDDHHDHDDDHEINDYSCFANDHNDLNVLNNLKDLNNNDNIDTSQSNTTMIDNFDNDIMELFWGKLITSIFMSNENNQQRQPLFIDNSLDIQSLSIIFKLCDGIVNILESRDDNPKRVMEFKQNFATILQPYRLLFDEKLFNIKQLLIKNLNYLNHHHQNNLQQCPPQSTFDPACYRVMNGNYHQQPPPSLIFRDNNNGNIGNP